MPELRDIYTLSGEKTGRTFVSGKTLAPGECYAHVIVLLQGRGGKYLLQQRALTDKYLPGQWDVTGGGVVSGEDSRAAAAREVREELGLALDAAQFVYGGSILQNNVCHLHMYGAKGNFDETDCRFDPKEVNAVRMADFDEFARIVAYNKDDAFMQLQARVRELLER